MDETIVADRGTDQRSTVGRGAGTVGQDIAPLQAVMNSSWVLSADAQDDLLDQLRINGTAIRAIRELLDHPLRCA